MARSLHENVHKSSAFLEGTEEIERESKFKASAKSLVHNKLRYAL